jgi:hypothetical protein
LRTKGYWAAAIHAELLFTPPAVTLPRNVREHLEDRPRTRQPTKDEMLRLMEWVLSGPEVPEGPWCKDCGTFTLAGEGKYR